MSTQIGDQLRDEGIALVAARNAAWMGNALRKLALWVAAQPPGKEFMADSFKHIPDIGSPAHPNAWGALSRIARRQGIIAPTGRYGKSSSALNHSHFYMIYTRGSSNFEIEE